MINLLFSHLLKELLLMILVFLNFEVLVNLILIYVKYNGDLRILKVKYRLLFLFDQLK